MATRPTRSSTSKAPAEKSVAPKAVGPRKTAVSGKAASPKAEDTAEAPGGKLSSASKAGQASTTEPTKPAPAKQEAVSLIDEKAKTPRKRVAGAISSFKGLAPISKLLEPEPPKVTKTAEDLEPADAAPEASPAQEGAESPELEASTTAVTAVEATESAESIEPKADEKVISLKPPIIVRELATALGLKPFEVIRDLMGMNIFVNLNQPVELEVATKICQKHGFTFEREKREKGAGVHKPVEKVVEPPKEPEKPKEDELKLRAPIVAFMGHVDHGKTTLMDAIRKTRVAKGEAGGITQHIGAYSVRHNDHPITFLDTPGHAAFSAMRARGANVTDIVVLVVAADDGMMPQTLEALSHAKAAKVHIIVAITKMDASGANLDRVKAQLQDKGLSPEDWGGDTICVPVSAIKGQGVKELLENILLVAEIAELKATSGGVARAMTIEAQVEQGRGPTATVIVRCGTLKVGAPFICGRYSGKVKGLLDDSGKPIKGAGPSTPVKVIGFSGLPNAGDELVVMESERAAATLSEERVNAERMNKLVTPERPTLENLFSALSEDQKKVLRVVIKSDVQGSCEALVSSLRQIQSKKIDLEIIHSAVGPISESDVLLAAASNAIIVGFNIKTENNAAATAKREGVQIKLFSIIYELIDQVKDAMAGMLDPESRETVIGHAEVRKVFDLAKGVVAGSYVMDGRILKTARARVLRGRQPIYDGGLATLRRFQDDVKEVRSGMECGIKLGNFEEYEEGDVIECYTLEKVPQQL
jgi:translation initiation factor IF-2